MEQLLSKKYFYILFFINLQNILMGFILGKIVSGHQDSRKRLLPIYKSGFNRSVLLRLSLSDILILRINTGYF